MKRVAVTFIDTKSHDITQNDTLNLRANHSEFEKNPST